MKSLIKFLVILTPFSLLGAPPTEPRAVAQEIHLKCIDKDLGLEHDEIVLDLMMTANGTQYMRKDGKIVVLSPSVKCMATVTPNGV